MSWTSALKITLFLLLTACFTLPFKRGELGHRLGFSPSIRRGQTKLVASLVVLFSLHRLAATTARRQQLGFVLRNMEPATDTENNVRRSKKKAKSGNGAAKEHKSSYKTSAEGPRVF
ncbi:hypothetical protein RIF29_18646 [Crotalaria pallida]|uniref:Uncharacterized protein n=1 Tax=Crotalaria pallida TaxID=3830 RepID=A0AAN9EYJ4_CROPI